MTPSKKPGRNEHCHCGSDKKYKKCCLRQDDERIAAEKKNEREQEQKKRERAQRNQQEAWEKEREERAAHHAEMIEAYGEETVESPESDNWLGIEDTIEEPAISYPKVAPIPEPDSEAIAIVDAWWDDFMPLYKEMNLEKMLAAIHAVCDKHPEAVMHLNLQEECFLELLSHLPRAGLQKELVTLLRRFRNEFPEAYRQCFEYFDLYLVAWELAATPNADITPLLDNFIAYPDSAPDNLGHLLDVLLVANRPDELRLLTEATAEPCALSPEVWSDGSATRWLVTSVTTPVLDRREYTDDAAEMLLETVAALPDSLHVNFNISDAKELLADAFAPLPEIPQRRSQYPDWIGSIYGKFFVWLHDTHGMSWPTAQFFAILPCNCLHTDFKKRKPLKNGLFKLTQKEMESYISDNYLQFLGVLDGLRAMGMLQGLVLLADYVEKKQLVTPAEASDLRKTATNLGEQMLGKLDSSDEARVLFSEFPHYPHA